MATKFIFVTGGVVSGLGKGITAASLGRLLINRGLSVGVLKLDCYLNIDTSNMSPYRHGEVFVTDDGAECDLDVGHYERFIGVNYSKNVNHTMGKIYQSVITKERAGDYHGRDVQVVPHVTDEIKHVIMEAGKGFDVAIVEVGGTVGEIEGMTYIEAIRQLKNELGYKGSMSIHVTLVPYLECSKEIKTKPTQNSVRDLRHMGISPSVVVCRSSSHIQIDIETREKIALFCNLDSVDNVIHAPDCRSIYEVPVLLKQQKLDDIVLAKLGLKAKKDNLGEWKKMVAKLLNGKTAKRIAVVGKYVSVPDSYISVTEAINHAAAQCNVKAEVVLVDSVEIEQNGTEIIRGFDAVVVPSGFGRDGAEGVIATAKFSRENNIPYLGICLGMQVAVVDFARNVCGLDGANSAEFDKNTVHPVISIRDSMRLGLYPCKLEDGTMVASVYDSMNIINERHRHRYEFNNKYKDKLGKAGLVFSGINEKSQSVEVLENPSCKFFIGCQFHPEFLSRAYKPHPLFVGLIKATL